VTFKVSGNHILENTHTLHMCFFSTRKCLFSLHYCFTWINALMPHELWAESLL